MASLTDSMGTERLIARPNESQWIAAGMSIGFMVSMWFKRQVLVAMTRRHCAILRENDTYRGTPTSGQLTGPVNRFEVTTFPVVTVNASSGMDSAELIALIRSRKRLLLNRYPLHSLEQAIVTT